MKTRIFRGLALVISIAAAVLFFIRTYGDPHPRQVSESAITAGESKSIAAPDGAAAGSHKAELVAATKAGESVDSKVMSAEILALSKEFELKNATSLLDKRVGGTELHVVAIAAPDVDQIDAISSRLTQMLEGVEPSQRETVRAQLQKIYKEAVSFKAAYKVLYSIQTKAQEAPTIAVVYRDDTNITIPGDDGPIQIEGRETSALVNPTSVARYDHLFPKTSEQVLTR